MQYNAQTRGFTGMHLLSKTNKLSLIIESSQHLVVVDWGLWELQRGAHLHLHLHQHHLDW
jgi:hypothetical protein